MTRRCLSCNEPCAGYLDRKRWPYVPRKNRDNYCKLCWEDLFINTPTPAEAPKSWHSPRSELVDAPVKGRRRIRTSSLVKTQRLP